MIPLENELRALPIINRDALPTELQFFTGIQILSILYEKKNLLMIPLELEPRALPIINRNTLLLSYRIFKIKNAFNSIRKEGVFL